MPRWTQTLEERLWSRVDKTGECWIWQGCRGSKGYGTIWVGNKSDGRRKATHRVSWELVNGPIPAGMYVCHKCDNPPCIRPDHLFIGSNADNMADMRAKGRSPKPVGSANPAAKLSESQVDEIRTRYARGGITQESLGAEFGITQSAVSQAVSSTHWKTSTVAAASVGLGKHKYASKQRPNFRPSKHGYMGIDLLPNGRWRARIAINGKNKHIGSFDTKEHAARAFNEAAMNVYGPFAKLNEVN